MPEANIRYFLRYNPSKKFVQQLYRLEPQQNGFLSLQYLTFANLWFYSMFYGEKVEEFIASELTEEVTEEQIQEYITAHRKAYAREYKELAEGQDK